MSIRVTAVLLAAAVITGCASPRTLDPAAADAAIDRAQRYLQRQGELQPDELAVLSYLARKFDLPWVKERRAPKVLQGLREGPWGPFYRLLEPGYRVRQSALLEARFPIDRMTLAALYCDLYGFPYDFRSQLASAFAGDGYWPTHAVVAAVWAQENGCFTAHEWPAMQTVILDALTRTLAAHPAVDDIFVEAVAMHYYAGLGDRVDQAWLAKIVAAQGFRGGWSVGRWDPRYNPHTTVLALWSLLEARRGNVRSVSWLH
jgi:hypothetical protein